MIGARTGIDVARTKADCDVVNGLCAHTMDLLHE